MKIYLLMVSINHNQEQMADFAYFDKEKATNAVRLWNDAQEMEDRKNAQEQGKEYEEWVGAHANYAFLEQVEIIN